MPASIVSVNVGPVRPLQDGGRVVPSAIDKRPVAGPVRVLPERLEGDATGNPEVHGRPDSAVYAYPSEHYEYWTPLLRPEGTRLSWGSFGENLTVAGILEDAIRPGDRLEIGAVILRVTRPRQPCFKLAAFHHRPSLIPEFQEAGRPGFYLAIEHTGSLAAGDPITLVPGGSDEPTIRAMFVRPRDPPRT